MAVHRSAQERGPCSTAVARVDGWCTHATKIEERDTGENLCCPLRTTRDGDKENFCGEERGELDGAMTGEVNGRELSVNHTVLVLAKK